MDIKFVLVVYVYLASFTNQGQAIRWLALQHANVQWNITSLNLKALDKGKGLPERTPCAYARKHYGFSKVQTKLCRRTVDMMPYIQKAAILASNTCKNTFQSRRWNCSSIGSAPRLTPDLIRATREQAYVYAISSATLTYVMAKACASGSFYHCTCASHPKDPPNGNFKWGGCGDNIKWGTRFSRRFIDSNEKHISHDSEVMDEHKLKVSRKRVAAANLHNNRVGRRMISESLATQCKCHGVSGSCSIKTCWKSLPHMAEIGNKLLRKYISAIDESSKNYSDINNNNLPEVPGRKSPSIDQLVYLTKSPDYCTRDKRLGSIGTSGRKCNITSTGPDSCSQLCCGRGYKMVIEEKLERCQCKYYYCCYVQCKTCRVFVEIYECI